MDNFYVRLIKDSYPCKKGTEFLVEASDDGMYSRNPFYSGYVTKDGRKYHISCDWEQAKRISQEEYTGKVILDTDFTDERTEECWEYTNYP